jgi:hypothetical protein
MGFTRILLGVMLVSASASLVSLPSESHDFEGASIVVGRGGVRETIGWCLLDDDIGSVDPAALLLSASRGRLYPDTMYNLFCDTREQLGSMSPLDLVGLLIGTRPPIFEKSVSQNITTTPCQTYVRVAFETPVLANTLNGWTDPFTFSTATVTVTVRGVPSRHMSMFPSL